MHAHPVARCTGSLLEPDKAVLMTPEVTATTSTTALQHYSTVACLGSTSPVFMAPSTSGPTCHATSTSRRKWESPSRLRWDIHKFEMMEHKVIAGQLFCTSLRKPCQRQDRRSGLMHLDAIWCLQNLTKVRNSRRMPGVVQSFSCLTHNSWALLGFHQGSLRILRGQKKCWLIWLNGAFALVIPCSCVRWLHSFLSVYVESRSVLK